MKFALRLIAVVIVLVLVAGSVFYFNPLWVADLLTRLHLWREDVKSEYVETGGYKLHYFEAMPAQGGGTPLVLIHGLGARGEDWSGMIPAMAAKGFHVYALIFPDMAVPRSRLMLTTRSRWKKLPWSRLCRP